MKNASKLYTFWRARPDARLPLESGKHTYKPETPSTKVNDDNTATDKRN